MDATFQLTGLLASLGRLYGDQVRSDVNENDMQVMTITGINRILVVWKEKN